MVPCLHTYSLGMLPKSTRAKCRRKGLGFQSYFSDNHVKFVPNRNSFGFYGDVGNIQRLQIGMSKAYYNE